MLNVNSSSASRSAAEPTAPAGWRLIFITPEPHDPGRTDARRRPLHAGGAYIGTSEIPRSLGTGPTHHQSAGHSDLPRRDHRSEAGDFSHPRPRARLSGESDRRSAGKQRSGTPASMPAPRRRGLPHPALHAGSVAGRSGKIGSFASQGPAAPANPRQGIRRDAVQRRLRRPARSR